MTKLLGGLEAERLARLSPRDRFKVLEKAKATTMGTEAERSLTVNAIFASGPIFDSSALTGDDPALMTMWEIIDSPDGRAACLRANSDGRPALAGVEDRIVEALGETYRKTHRITMEAGALVGQMMRGQGYKPLKQIAMPAGSVAKTATIWTRAKSG